MQACSIGMLRSSIYLQSRAAHHQYGSVTPRPRGRGPRGRGSTSTLTVQPYGSAGPRGPRRPWPCRARTEPRDRPIAELFAIVPSRGRGLEYSSPPTWPTQREEIPDFQSTQNKCSNQHNTKARINTTRINTTRNTQGPLPTHVVGRGRL